MDLKAIGRLLTNSLPEPPDQTSDLKSKKSPKLNNYINIEGYWISKGDGVVDNDSTDPNYILTPGIRANLKDLVRVVSAR